MKKMFKLLVIMFIFYFAIQSFFYLFSKGHSVSYKLEVNGTDVYIDEVLTIKKEYTDGYYFNINFDNYNIPFKVLNTYKRQRRIIDNVALFYGDSYVCANIAIKEDYNVSDIKCIKDNVIYFYNSIKGNDDKLDSLVASSNYDSSKYLSEGANAEKDNITYYYNNYIDTQTILLSGYKGVYLFGKNVTNNARYIALYTNDHYVKDLEGVVGKYYVSPDYNNAHEFLTVNVINIATGVTEKITSPDFISFSSYIQGTMEDKMYLIDTEYKKQYVIDLKNKNIEVIGNVNRGASAYTKDGWVTKNINELIDSKEKFYDNVVDSLNSKTYDYIKFVGGEVGVYYVYINNGAGYDAYVVYSEDSEYRLNYAFSCTDYNRVNYVNGYVYYSNGDQLRVFRSDIGNKTILKYNELNYNNNLNYYVY
ncbi:MAG: hypothetical protein IJ565_01355 [Bacilli bacterium]|nr:hypothetical protein [Bacilli bacterium]